MNTRQVTSWAARAGGGLVRACVVLVLSMVVPAVWAATVALGIRWGAGNPWSWLPVVLVAPLATLVLSRPVCRAFRSLVTRWTDTVIAPGYRQAPPVVLMSTGYWWNGFSYERTHRDARLDQRWRLRWNDPANWRDLRFTAIVPLTAGLLAAVPPAGVAAAVIGMAQPALPARLIGVLGLAVAIGSAPYALSLIHI